MIIIAAFETTEIEANDYTPGFTKLRDTVPDGQRIINIRVQRS